MMRFFRAVALSALLVACGFQLRGQVGLPEAMDRTYLSAPQPNGELARQLKRLLRANGVELTPSPDGAGAVLEIIDERMQRQVQSVGIRARVREFALHYDVSFRVVGDDGTTLVPVRHLQLVRDYTFDQQQVLGTASEEEILMRDLRRTMAGRILATLSAD